MLSKVNGIKLTRLSTFDITETSKKSELKEHNLTNTILSEDIGCGEQLELERLPSLVITLDHPLKCSLNLSQNGGMDM